MSSEIGSKYCIFWCENGRENTNTETNILAWKWVKPSSRDEQLTPIIKLDKVGWALPPPLPRPPSGLGFSNEIVCFANIPNHQIHYHFTYFSFDTTADPTIWLNFPETICYLWGPRQLCRLCILIRSGTKPRLFANLGKRPVKQHDQLTVTSFVFYREDKYALVSVM